MNNRILNEKINRIVSNALRKKLYINEVKLVNKSRYMHKNVAEKGYDDILPRDVYEFGLNTLMNSEYSDFANQFNCVCWSPNDKIIRFDYSEDFDTCTEPILTKYVSVLYDEDRDGNKKVRGMKVGSSPAVWHNKDAWVDDDYDRFDRGISSSWREMYMKEIKNNPKYGKNPNGGSRKAWMNHLMLLDADNGNSTLIDKYFELNGIEDPIGYLSVLDGMSGKKYGLVDQYNRLHDSRQNHLNETIKRIVRESLSEIEYDKRFKRITDYSKYPNDSKWNGEDEEEPQSDKQEIDSKDTSMSQIPRTFKSKTSGIIYPSGTLNFDIGGGKYDHGTKYMTDEYGVINVIFDPYNRTPEFNNKAMDMIEKNGGADSVTVNNCLNVIKGQKFIENVIKQAAVSLKPDGCAIFQIYKGNGSGIGAITSRGYQQNKKAKEYVQLIHKFFNVVNIDNGNDCIIAEEPIISAEDVDFYPDKDGEPRRLRFK